MDVLVSEHSSSRQLRRKSLPTFRLPWCFGAFDLIMTLATFHAAIGKVAVCCCVTYSFAFFTVLRLIILDSFESHLGMLNSLNASNVFFSELGGECTSPRSSGTYIVFARHGDEGFDTDDLLFFFMKFYFHRGKILRRFCVELV